MIKSEIMLSILKMDFETQRNVWNAFAMEHKNAGGIEPIAAMGVFNSEVEKYFGDEIETIKKEFSKILDVSSINEPLYVTKVFDEFEFYTAGQELLDLLLGRMLAIFADDMWAEQFAKGDYSKSAEMFAKEAGIKLPPKKCISYKKPKEDKIKLDTNLDMEKKTSVDVKDNNVKQSSAKVKFKINDDGNVSVDIDDNGDKSHYNFYSYDVDGLLKYFIDGPFKLF